MPYTVLDISRLITEDPDVFLLFEASPQKYLPYFNKSKVRLPPHYTPTNQPWTDIYKRVNETLWTDGGIESSDPDYERIFRNKLKSDPEFEKLSRHQYAEQPTLADMSPDDRIHLIERIQAVVDPSLRKYEQYFIRQVAIGRLQLDRIEEDSQRLNETVMKFIKHSRKAYWKEKGLATNILDFPDWRELEQLILKLEEENIEYDKKDEDKGTFFSKVYINNVMSLLLGEPPEAVKYWFRGIYSYAESKKYGAGTTWCTRNSRTYYDQYQDEAGIYIIEIQTPTVKRRPIIQISGCERTNQDNDILSKFGPRLGDFAKEVIKRFKNEINPITVENLEELIV